MSVLYIGRGLMSAEKKRKNQKNAPIKKKEQDPYLSSIKTEEIIS